MHRLSSTFVLGYHGCDRAVGEKLLSGASFQPSDNEYDWLGPGVYFWEANPLRGYKFAQDSARRKGTKITEPYVIGAVVELGLCLDLTTSSGVEWLKVAYESLAAIASAADLILPSNGEDRLRRNLDCAVVRRLHTILEDEGLPAIDTVKGVFSEGRPAYPGAGFAEKTHIQVAVRNAQCIKGVFRVPKQQLQEP